MNLRLFRNHTAIDVSQAASEHRHGDLILVDVRERDERSQGYARGSWHIPLGELNHQLDELPKHKPLAFICQSGRRSAIATAVARRAGLDARNVRGGMNAWQRAGLDTDRRTA
jgi:rhodanese-related sulfurtransferase